MLAETRYLFSQPYKMSQKTTFSLANFKDDLKLTNQQLLHSNNCENSKFVTTDARLKFKSFLIKSDLIYLPNPNSAKLIVPVEIF